MYKKIVRLFGSNQIPLILFFGSLFIFLSFAGTRMLFSDEGVIVSQFYNFIHGSLELKVAKVNVEKGIYITVANHLYGKFSYSLLVLSLPVYFALKNIDIFYGAHLFLLQIWALSGGISFYLLAKAWQIKKAFFFGLAFCLFLILVNMRSFDPIYFPKWGEIISIEFTNILITSFLIVMIYFLFRKIFNDKIAIFSSLFIIFATPISFYALTLKHHSLALLLTVLAFYFLYRCQEKKDIRYMYAAYILAGLCIWTRTLDGAALMLSLLFFDIIFFRRGIKHLALIAMIIFVSLTPFFSFNQMILGDPFSIIELHPLSDTPMRMQIEQNMITLSEGPAKIKQTQLLEKLGFTWGPNISTGTLDVLFDILILKLGNTFGILLISPFLIMALAFILDRIKGKIRLSPIDKFLGIYAVIFFILHKNYIQAIITDTPIVLEYRYLLIMYIVLLYFALRINKVRELIESNIKKIALLYISSAMILVFFFIEVFPSKFIGQYHSLGLVTSGSLMISLSLSIFWDNKNSFSDILDKTTLFLMSLSLALTSVLLLFYYWIVTITYISPSQNLTIIPIMENILKWMYQVFL
ncbi:MAG: glycosyltransferase family 39 protein [Candidatus Methanoperedens sp.]|nr:glycosyltransferase family 39 protein [Candidatus Methanoperedens sp.]